MSRAREHLRRAHKYNALSGLGVDPYRTRVFAGDVQNPGIEAAILALPVYSGVSGYSSNVTQSSSGALYFVVDLSDPFGSEIVSP